MSTSPAAISKREQKRQAKLAKEQAEKAQADGIASSVEASIEVLPVLDAETNGDSTTNLEQKSSPFIEPVQKRIRNYLKKKQKIDQLAERANDPEEYKKLNKDQLEQLARKDQVLAPLKELQNLAEQFTQINEDHNKSQSQEAAETTKTHASAIDAAKEAGREEGRTILSALLAFLGHASLLRANPTTDKNFNEASERLLNIVYLGGDAAIEAATKLSAGSDDLVDDTTVSYKQVHEAIYPSEKATNEDSTTEVSPATDSKDGPAEPAGSNFISLSELSQKPSTIGSGGISFLNESEIEGAQMPESVGVPLSSSTNAVPGQTVAEDDGNKAAEDLTWASMEKPRTNWADEDPISDVGITETATETIAPPPEDAPEKGGLQPLSEFKTIEKKSQNRDGGRGRGRGNNTRGRGERGGRGRGGKPRAQESQ